jgi:hypothetical protein
MAEVKLQCIAVLVGIALTACNGDESVNDPPVDDPNANYTFALAPDSLALKGGETGVTTLTVSRTAGFRGQVAFAVVDPPAGVSITIGPVAQAVESYPVTVIVAAATAPGSYAITLRGSTPNRADRTVTLRLVVPVPQYRLVLEPQTLRVQPGAQNIAFLSTSRDPAFTGPITLSASGAPDGVTVTIASASDTRVMLVAVANSVSIGSYEIVIRATTPSRPDQTVTLTLIVEAGAAGGNTTVRFCGPFRPIFFAIQDGNAPWRPVAGSVDTYTFDIASERGAFAFVIRIGYVGGGVAFETFTFYGTQAELNVFSSPCTTSNLGFVSTSVVNGGGDVKVALGYFATRQVNNLLLPLQRALWDLVAWSSDVRGHQPRRAIIRRDQSAPAGSVLPVLDFQSTEAFDLLSRQLTIPSGVQYLEVVFHSRNATWAPLICYDFVYNYEFCSVSTYDTYPGVPTPLDGDAHRFTLWAEDNMIMTCYKEATNQSLVLPPLLGQVDRSTVATTPSPRFRARYTRQPEYDGGVQITYANREPTFVSRQVEINISAGYLGLDALVDVTIPDFSVLAGWGDHWGLAPGVAPSFRFEARGSARAPGASATACGGESNPFDRHRPEASQIHAAWTSTAQGAPEQNAVRPVHGGWTRGQDVIRGVPLGGNARR